MAIQKGNKIKIEYIGKLDDGTVFDSSELVGEPLTFEVGSGELLPKFDEAFIGMEKDQEKEITLLPKDGYGEHNIELLKKVPKDKMPKDVELKPCMVLGVATPDGKQFPVIIAEVSENDVTIDLNHPLAGKTLNFKIKVLDVIE